MQYAIFTVVNEERKIKQAKHFTQILIAIYYTNQVVGLNLLQSSIMKQRLEEAEDCSVINYTWK